MTCLEALRDTTPECRSGGGCARQLLRSGYTEIVLVIAQFNI